MSLLAGCAWTDHHGVRHTLVIGVGYVSQATTNGVSASDLGAVGITWDRGVTIGLVRSHHVEIDPNTASNAVVSIRAAPFSLEVKSLDPYGEGPSTHDEEEGKK